jgi:hypothetical protein
MRLEKILCSPASPVGELSREPRVIRTRATPYETSPGLGAANATAAIELPARVGRVAPAPA